MLSPPGSLNKPRLLPATSSVGTVETLHQPPEKQAGIHGHSHAMGSSKAVPSPFPCCPAYGLTYISKLPSIITPEGWRWGWKPLLQA